MLQDPLTLYKLIVLYMLNRVTFPLTAAQVSDFILGKEYTNFLTLQQVINELTDAGMIATQSIRNRASVHHSRRKRNSEFLRKPHRRYDQAGNRYLFPRERIHTSK